METKIAESLRASSRSEGVAQRTKSLPEHGHGAGALEPRRPAVADEEAADEQEAAHQVEAERDGAVQAGAEQQAEQERPSTVAATMPPVSFAKRVTAAPRYRSTLGPHRRCAPAPGPRSRGARVHPRP